MRLLWEKTIHCFNVNTDIKRDLETCLELMMQPSGRTSKVDLFQVKNLAVTEKAIIRTKGRLQVKKHHLH